MKLGDNIRLAPINDALQQIEAALEEAKQLVKQINTCAPSGLVSRELLVDAGKMQRTLDRLSK